MLLEKLDLQLSLELRSYHLGDHTRSIRHPTNACVDDQNRQDCNSFDQTGWTDKPNWLDRSTRLIYMTNFIAPLRRSCQVNQFHILFAQIRLRMRKLCDLKVFRFLNYLTPVFHTGQTGMNRSDPI
jgi:hypothetical protein